MSIAANVRPGVPFVLATVGSDHHRFDRLVDWLDDWASLRPDVDVFIQYGTSKHPNSPSAPYVSHDELAALMRRADVIVTQGGPMSIVEARDAGRIPVVVARDPMLGEHVDGHQLAFCRRLNDDGLIYAANGATEFRALLDAGVDDPTPRMDADPEADARLATASQRLGNVIAELGGVQSRPKVLLMVGSGRSGSTLLERALGDVPGVASLGETVHLWERGVRDHELCGCGLTFDKCEFWSAVGKAAFDGWETLDLSEVVADRHRVVRTRRYLELLTTSPSAQHRLERDRMVSRLGRLYGAAYDTSGARLLVDSSKLPAYAALARRAQVDLRCVHVVRDPRGVAHSWAKSVKRPEVVDEAVMMPRYGAARSAATWTTFAGLATGLRTRGVPLTTVRYEDFLDAPAETLQRLLDFAGHDTGTELAHVDGRRIQLREAHTVAGNPMRFKTGAVDLVRDDAWRSQLPARDRRVVGLLTAGVRRAFGY